MKLVIDANVVISALIAYSKRGSSSSRSMPIS